MVTGWKQDGEKWYFLHADGAMAYGTWLLLEEKWYHFETNGEMSVNKIVSSDGKKFYVHADGAMVTKAVMPEVTYAGVTYEVAEDGVCTADQSIQNKINNFVQIALNEKGKKEAGINKTPYNNWYYNKEVSGKDYAWCSVFVLWAGNNAGILDGNIMPTLNEARKGVYEGVRNLEKWYVAKGRVQDSAYNPKQGDIIFFTWSHVGIVVAYDEDADKIYTIEGNTEDAVRLQVQPRKSVKYFGVNGGNSYGIIPKLEELNPSSKNKYR